MTKTELKEAHIIMNRICDNMGIVAEHLRTNIDVKIKRLSRALQLYRQHQELERCQEEIGGFMFGQYSPGKDLNYMKYGFSKN